MMALALRVQDSAVAAAVLQAVWAPWLRAPQTHRCGRPGEGGGGEGSGRELHSPHPPLRDTAQPSVPAPRPHSHSLRKLRS